MLKFSHGASLSFIVGICFSVASFFPQSVFASDPLLPGDQVRYFDGFLKLDVVVLAIHTDQSATVQFTYNPTVGRTFFTVPVVKIVPVSKLEVYHEIFSLGNLRVGDAVRIDHEGGLPTFDVRIVKLFSDDVATVAYNGGTDGPDQVRQTNVLATRLVPEVTWYPNAEIPARDVLIGEAMHFGRPDHPSKDATIEKLFADGFALIRYVVRTKDGSREIDFPQRALVELSQLRHRVAARPRCEDAFIPVGNSISSSGRPL